MRIGAVNAVNSISNAYGISSVRANRAQHVQRTQSADLVGKKLQSEIADKQQTKNRLSSNASISAEQKASQSIELQQGISSLKAQLRRHQIETGREQTKPEMENTSGVKEELAKEAEAKAAKEEARKEELKKAEEEKAARKEQLAEEAKAAEKTGKDTKALAASDTAKDQIEKQNSIIAKTEAGIVIKKGEMNQDKARGVNTDRKQDEIKAQEKRARMLTNITLGPKGVSNGSGGMKAANYAKQAQNQNQNIIHQGSDGIVLFKTG